MTALQSRELEAPADCAAVRAMPEAGRPEGEGDESEVAGLALAMGDALPPGRRWLDRASLSVAVCVAVSLHAALLWALIAAPPELAGGGGNDLEAISVTLVDSRVLESLSRRKAPVVAGSVAAISQANAGDGKGAAREASISSPPPRPPEVADPAAEPAKTRDVAEPVETVRPEAAEPKTLRLSETAPDHGATVAVPPNPPALAVAAAAKLPPMPKPDAKQPAVKPAELVQLAKPAVSAPMSIAQTAAAGGAIARARTGIAESAGELAAASPGVKRAFANKLRVALAASRPRLSKNVRAGPATTKIEFSVSPSGGLRSVRVIKSSGVPHYDEAVIRAIGLAVLPVPPEGMSPADLTYQMPFYFR